MIVIEIFGASGGSEGSILRGARMGFEVPASLIPIRYPGMRWQSNEKT